MIFSRELVLSPRTTLSGLARQAEMRADANLVAELTEIYTGAWKPKMRGRELVRVPLAKRRRRRVLLILRPR